MNYDFSAALPTEKQLDFADSLIQQLKRAQNQDARKYEGLVSQCVSRTEMSALINRMRVALDAVRDSDRGLG